MRMDRSDEAHAVSFVYWVGKRSYRFATPAKGPFRNRNELGSGGRALRTTARISTVAALGHVMRDSGHDCSG